MYWNGHEFEVIPTGFIKDDGKLWWRLKYQTAHEQSMTCYFPLDQRTTAKDWHGAIGAESNEFNDAWLQVWDPDVPIDHEHALLSAVSHAFQDEEANLRATHDNAIHGAIVSDSGRPALATARQTLAAFIRFRGMVKTHICLLYTSPSPRDS